MITLNEFLYLYHLKASTHYGYFELLPWDRKSRVVRGFPSSFCDWKSQYFFVSGKGWETLSDDFWGEVHRLLQKWEVPALGEYLHHSSLLLFIVWVLRLMTLFFWSASALDRPDFEDQYHHHVLVVLAYACEVDDFDDFVDPRQLYTCCFGPEPLRYMLEKIRRKEKSKIFLLTFLILLLSLTLSSLLLTSSLFSNSVYYLFRLGCPLSLLLSFFLKKNKKQKWQLDIVKISMLVLRT